MSTIYVNVQNLNELKVRDGMICIGAEDDLQINLRMPEGWEILMSYALGLGESFDPKAECDCHPKQESCTCAQYPHLFWCPALKLQAAFPLDDN